MDHPDFEFLFHMVVQMGEGAPLGQTPYGVVSFQHAVGGTVEGPRIRGRLLPVGGDRVVGRADGTQEINVQALIRTEDNHHILMAYRGLIRAATPAGAGAAAAAPADVYWRTAPFFETSAEPYLWLNGLVAVGLGAFGEKSVSYRVYGLV